MKKIFLILILVIIGAGIWFSFSGQLSKKQDIGLANPASVFCVDNGGRLDIRTDSSGGQAGFCVFEDNTECDEWAYFRGECKMGGQNNEKVNVENYLRENISKIFPSNKNGISGTVTLGPTCPVERIPPDPNCAPKFYSTSINIMKTGSTSIVKTIQSDSNGTFKVDLVPGVYTLQARGGSVLPRCGEVSVEVKNGQYTNADISCDTGIR